MFIRPIVFGLSDLTENLLFLFFLLHLSNSAFSLRLSISTVGWTPRLDGALDVSSLRCIGRLGYGLDSIQGT